MKIVVDAMGGDYAPANVIAGVVQAVKELPVTVVLVGKENLIKEHLSKYKFPEKKIEIVHASEVVDMHDTPTDVIRKKKDCSITVGINLLRTPGYDAFISAGNTGACVAAATFYLRMIEGVDRPGIGIVIPQLNGFSFLIDVGANTEPKPEHLYQYGQMARVYAQAVMGKENPTVGMVNIGEEEGKGSGFEKETYQILQDRLPSFIGNVEPNEMFIAKADCIVCTGFIGNVIIKTAEGLMEAASKLLKRRVMKDPLAILGSLLMMGSLKKIKKQADYSEYGGALLLGVNGIVMISHGRSSPKAIKNAIRAAMHEVDHKIIDKLKTAVVSGS